MLSRTELEAAVENLTADEFDDIEANFKIGLRLKLEIGVTYLALGFGTLLAMGYLIIGLRELFHPSKLVALPLVIVTLGAWFVLFRWSVNRMLDFFNRRGLSAYMKEKGYVRSMSVSKN
jgi:hypothetical protein